MTRGWRNNWLIAGPCARTPVRRFLPVVAVILSLLVLSHNVHAQPAATVDSATKATAKSTATDLKAMERKIQETLKRVLPSVVSVSGGSGVVISEDGYVLTVAHVGMRAGRRISITFPNGKRVQGRTLGNDRGVDAGLVKIEGEGPFPFVEMGKSEDLKDGQWCLALGYPVSFERGKEAAVRVGRVLRNRDTMVITDCTIMGGDSGGPLIDLNGKVIGISSRCDNRLTMNIHVPVDRFRDQWARLEKGEDFNSLQPDVAYLGIRPVEGSDKAEIGSVSAGTGAAKAGLKLGDLIVKLDGQPVKQYDDLPPLIRKHKPGDDVEIEIRRGGQTLRLKAKLGKRPD